MERSLVVEVLLLGIGIEMQRKEMIEHLPKEMMKEHLPKEMIIDQLLRLIGIFNWKIFVW